MIAAVHALVGAAIGKVAGEPKGALMAGFGSHLLCDLLPHRDFPVQVEAPLLAATMSVLAWKCGPDSPEFVGACAAVAPDIENAAMLAGIIPPEAMRYPSHLGVHGRKTESVLPQVLLAAACLGFVLFKARR
ncbi:MAG: hypothetical protein SFU56_10460 [Capsulimonadales bacterium]|nr:hypothetical protein [Capsulimonadales bacterium]